MIEGITFVSTTATHQIVHGNALCEGMRAIGVKATRCTLSNRIRTKHVACWGWRVGKRLRDAGHEVLVMERGYLGDRFAYTSLGWNGLNGYADFPKYPSDGGERFRRIGGVLKPWKQDGKYVLLLGQVPRDASLRGIDMLPFYENWVKQAQSFIGLPVMFRAHPDVVRRGLKQNVAGAETSTGSLEEALSEAAVCATFNSNSSVDSVLAGVPTVLLDRGAMSWDVTGHNFREIVRPPREEWAYNLAFTQWTVEEIRSGAPMEKLVRMAGAGLY